MGVDYGFPGPVQEITDGLEVQVAQRGKRWVWRAVFDGLIVVEEPTSTSYGTREEAIGGATARMVHWLVEQRASIQETGWESVT